MQLLWEEHLGLCQQHAEESIRASWIYLWQQ
jgi:hypothetical protein